MKPWMWILIAVALLAVIIYGIYAWQKSAKEERELEAKKLAMQAGEEPTKSNIWEIIAGISGVLGEAGLGGEKLQV